MAAYNSHTGRGNNYTTNNQEVRSSYARMTSPDVAPEGPSPGKPVFVMNQDIPGERNVDLQDMYKALCKSVDTKNIVGVQRIGGLWRLYIAERELRIKLITEGLQIRNASVRVYDKNPYLLHENENAVRVVIKDVPLSVHESVIRDGLESANCKIYGPITYPKLRVDGKLTQCLTGDRAVYIDPPPQPLPRYMHFHSFRARVFHHGQPNSEAAITCSRCLQTGHHRTKCTNQMVCRLCKNTGHIQNSCPAAAGKNHQQPEADKQTPTRSQSGDSSRGEAAAVPKPTDKPSEKPRSHNAETANERATSSAPLTRSKTAAADWMGTCDKGSRDRKQRAPKVSAMQGKSVLGDLEVRSRSNSAPNLTDAQTKITEYWKRSSSESEESDGDYDETAGEQSSVLEEPTEIQAVRRKEKPKGRKRRRKNLSSNGRR